MEFELYKEASLIFRTPENESYKFGYYNYSPISNDGSRLLGHKVFFEGRMPLPEDKVEIGYFTLDDQIWHKVAESNAFNWQQGSMLQWLGPDFNSKIIFNDSDGGKYIARIIDINTLEEKVIPKAIYGVTPDGKTSVSLNFERCNFTRAYSYAPIVDKSWDVKIPEKDAVIKIDLTTGEYKNIIAINDVLDGVELNEEDGHWFEHITLNPEGSRFSFYHRYGGSVFTTRAFTADMDGKDLWLHPNTSTEKVTHLGWRDSKSYVLYTVVQSKLNIMMGGKNKKKKQKWYLAVYRSLIRPFVPRKLVKTLPKPKSFYTLTEDRNGVIAKYNPQPGNMDGHPGFTADGRYMLTDTYSDKDNYRHLLIYDTKKDKSYMLGKFYSVYNNCGWRTDLHPRFSKDEEKVIIDSNHNGNNSIMVLNINWDLIRP